MAPDARAGGSPKPSTWPALLIWAAGWSLLLLLDPVLDLPNKALVLVLLSASGSLWLAPPVSLVVATVAVLAFDYAFVEPRGTFVIDMRQDALLLATLLAVSWLVAILMSRQRRLAAQARVHAERAEALRMLGDAVREADDPRDCAGYLAQLLETLTGGSATLLIGPVTTGTPAADDVWLGPATQDERAGLQFCRRDRVSMGPGTGRYEEQPGWYLPMRGRRDCAGAVLLRPGDPDPDPNLLGYAQAACDQLGHALERVAALRREALAREAEQAQALRNTLLAAVAHDHRTPLATILGAASSLLDQADRLAPEQRHHLAAVIADEAAQLARLTDNTLQLARLDAPGITLDVDWESAEELIGAVVRRVRARAPSATIRTRVEPELPLLRCNAVLVAQLLDNLLDNALKYGHSAESVEVVACLDGDHVVIAVQDRGPGVPEALREQVFDAFQRGAVAPAAGVTPSPRGAGLGLALCRAVARAHGAELHYRARSGGGSAFELRVPVPAAPVTPPPPGEPGS